MAKQTYTVKRRVEHDKKLYVPGHETTGTIQLEDEHAAPLLKSGAIERAPEQPAAKPRGGK